MFRVSPTRRRIAVEDVAPLLVKLRQQCEWSQRDAAQELGIQTQTIQRIEQQVIETVAPELFKKIRERLKMYRKPLREDT